VAVSPKGEGSGRLKLEIEMTSTQAAEFLKLLAYDNSFRKAFMRDAGGALRDSVGIDVRGFEEDLKGASEHSWALPTKPQLLEILKAIQFPDPCDIKPTPWPFIVCSRMALIAYAAAAADTTPDDA
jgi:hypothetical protein